MVNAMKIPTFKGIGSEDLEQFWFVVNVLWTSQQIIDDNIKNAQLVTLQGRALTWYIKYFTDNPLATLVETKKTLNKEFNKPKFESQLVIEFKKIMMNIEETPWNFDQRLKCQIK